MARVMNVIYTEERRGLGTNNDPIRLVAQLWSLDGELLAERDESPKEHPDTASMFANPRRIYGT